MSRTVIFVIISAETGQNFVMGYKNAGIFDMVANNT